VALACLLYSLVQRVLSTQVRYFRRKVHHIEGHFYAGDPLDQEYGWGQTHNLQKEHIIAPPENALRLMTWTVVAAAIAAVLMNF